MLPIKDCTGCLACVDACTSECIQVVPDAYGFWYPEIQTDRCIDCKKCEKVCPLINLSGNNENDPVNPEALAGYIKSNEIRAKSSSGGIFTALALKILESDGVVVGAAFDAILNVSHIIIESEDDLFKLRGSKYVQSNVLGCYKKVRALLQKGVTVLFSGTPCQIAAMQGYLGKAYENLVLLDIVCHGVPSCAVWQEYLNWQARRHGSQPTNANFRDKSSGWEKFSLSLSFQNGTEYKRRLDEDAYMKAFLQNLCLRKSCYQCRYKTKQRLSDLTIGDLWGINEIAPELNDDSGISVVFIQSKKGRRLLDSINRSVHLVNINSELSIEKNGAMTHSVYKPPMREYFFRKLGTVDFDKLVVKCLDPDLKTRLERKALQLINKL